MGSSLLIALSMYSILPVPRVEWKEDNMRWSLSLAFPWWACWAAGFLLDGRCSRGHSRFPHLLRRCRRTAADHLVGRIPYGWVPRRDRRHFFSRRDRDRKLEIMKDPHCGPLPCCPVPRCCYWSSGRGANWSPPRCFGPRVPPVFCPAVPRSRPGAAFPTPNPALSGFCLRDVLPRRSPLRGGGICARDPPF